ncbi:MAG: S1-like domain-containing RNA-binding protein, partial [Prevotella sp.]|nr:S1-like domain-containing RNA-binding protein [Prevotella sp.]
MSKEIRLGEYNLLRVKEEAHREGFGEVFGMYLDAGREGEILMPQKYVPEGTMPGDEIECFVYLDQDERPIATTEKPFAKVGDFAYLECSWVNEYGAFLNWGLTKDIFCPFREQKKRMEIGDKFIV